MLQDRGGEGGRIKMFKGVLHWESHITLENSLNWWRQVEYLKTSPLPDQDGIHHLKNLFQFCLVSLKPSGLVRRTNFSESAKQLSVPHKPPSSFMVTIGSWERKITNIHLVHILLCSWADLKRACKLACISTETPISAYYQIPCYHCVATLALYDMVGCTREQGSSTLTVYSSLLFLSHCVPITLFFSSA